jgi:hypothetical protein
MKITEKQARKVLEQAGYYTANLWSIEDVKSKFKCSDEDALYILDKALTNDGTKNQIWEAIDIFGEENDLVPVKNESYYLFTESDTIKAFHENGIDVVEKDIKELSVRYELYCHDENSPSEDLASQFNNWNDYATLTKEEFEQLSNL